MRKMERGRVRVRARTTPAAWDLEDEVRERRRHTDRLTSAQGQECVKALCVCLLGAFLFVCLHMGVCVRACVYMVSISKVH